MKRVNARGLYQRLTRLMYRVVGGTVEWGLPVVACWKVDYLSFGSLASLFCCFSVSLSPSHESGSHVSIVMVGPGMR